MKLQHHHKFMLSFSKTLFVTVMQRPAFIFLGFMAMTAMTFFSAVFYFIEHEVNPKVQSGLDAAYFTVSTMTSVGFGDITPSTSAGKVAAMIMMLLGTFIYVSFTAVVASTIMEIDLAE